MKQCIICGSTRHTSFKFIKSDDYIHAEVRYFKCGGCGLVSIQPPPLEALKKMYHESYQQKIGIQTTLKSLVPLSFRNVHLNYLKRKGLLQLKGDVLEIGSGTGRILYLLKWRGWNVLGIEPTARGARFTSKVLKIPVINKFIEGVKLNRKFDLIMMLDVLEHTANPVRVLKKMKPLMKIDGRLYLSVPRLKPHLRHGILAAPHLFMFNANTIRKILDKTGFVVESMDLTDDKIYLICYARQIK